MMATHDPRHDALMQAVLLGDAGPESAAAKELQACDVCREQLRELLATAAELHAAGREQRAVLAAGGQGLEDGDARELVSRAVRTGLRQRHGAGRRVPWQWLALAAALLLGLLVWSQLPGDGGAGRGGGGANDQMLGAQHELWPRAQAEVTLDELRALPLTWPGRPDAEYRISLWPADDEFGLIVEETVTGTSFQLPPDALAKLRGGGKQYVWRYEPRDSSAAAGQQGFSVP